MQVEKFNSFIMIDSYIRSYYSHSSNIPHYFPVKPYIKEICRVINLISHCDQDDI